MCIRDSDEGEGGGNDLIARLQVKGHQGDQEGVSARGNGDACLLYTSDAADERSSVDLGGRRIIKKKNRCSRRKALTC